ncbi:T9SS type A sorting domain-containing protein [Flavobacterium terrigena]|uniref:Por secretion system C-terminal sorting domain-containing protein n=1 Tax=Flavobacterium terrigena TaxID=402734 RepID=A0A1H6XR07_9FLAO|nr:T9SS type A sorting domain-containing protein [Flavobacterium terrigena]SEJ27322.1 Por secretion system C-terminal sorting domain-containing protein [Flavobacterium terrigena]
MKKTTLFLSLIFCFGSVVYAQNKSGDKTVFGKKVLPENISPSGHIRCATSEYEQYLREKNPSKESAELFEKWMAKKIEEQRSIGEVASQSGGIIYIPVVVHVIHNGDAYGTNENISDEQVQSQITVMNQDFRRMSGTPGFNSDPVGADVQVEFILAKVDPSGNPTNGINRVNLCQASWSTDDIDLIVKPTTIWDPALYMNMWSVDFSDNTLLGYAQFPESNLGGMSPAAQDPNSDGVVANFATFGSSALATGSFSPPYDRGRTMTHEVGHFLGLRHIWGDNSACPATNTINDEDFVADTPASAGSNFGCPAGTNSCPLNPGNDMIANYMDYTDDTCMNIFTAGQKTRILTVLGNSPRRNYAASNKDVAIPLFANDAEVKIEMACGAASPSCTTPNPASPAKTVLLYNRGTSNLTSATLSYNFGGTVYTNNWTGNLAPNKYATIVLANSSVNGLLTVSVTAANGGADQRASNNVATKSFGSTLAYANSTTFTFNLVGDSYGSETSWTLRNQAGTILYSHGAYTDIPSGTQVLENNTVWNLPTGCYYLTMMDSWGDGLNNGVVQGYYTVTGGATTVVNETAFTGPGGNTPNSKVHYFTNNVALNSDSFSLMDDVVLYPNPAKERVTISVPQGLDVVGNFEVYNALGQKVLTKNVSSENDLNINTNDYQAGMYFINLTLGEFSKTLRFIKD